MTEKQIESLLGQLSDKLKALKGTYSDFAEKCEKPGRDSIQISEKPDFFGVFTGFKEELNGNLRVLGESKKGLLRKMEKVKGFGQGSVMEKVFEEFGMVVKTLENLEKNTNFLSSDLLELEKSLKAKLQEDSESIQTLKAQCQAHRKTQSLDYWDQSPVLTNRHLELNTQYYEETECQHILEKMNSVTERIHYKADLLETRPNKDLFRTQGPDNSKNKLVHNLESELNRLRNTIRALEEKEIRSFEYRAKYESAQFELTELLNKVEFLERTLTEKEFKSRQLLKALEESQKERKRSFESFSKCREEFEFQLEEQDLLIKKLTEGENEQRVLVKTLSHQLGVLNKEKNELEAENQRLCEDLGACGRRLKERGLELSQRVGQLGDDSEVGQCLGQCEAEKEEIRAQLDRVKDQFKSRSAEVESLKSSLKLSKAHLNEAKSNLNSLFLEYEALKSVSSTNGASSSLQTKLEETETLNLEYHGQLTSLQSSFYTLQQSFNMLESKSAEQ